jgi:PAS domain S-box-containing protein
MTDSTARIQIEQQLVVVAAGIGMWRYDITSDSFYGDDIVRQLLGLDPSSQYFNRESVLARVHPDSSAVVGQYFCKSHDDDVAHSISFQASNSDGEDQFVIARARFIPDLDGSAGQLVGVLMDDTDHQLLQEDLRQSEEWLQMLVHGVPQSFLYMDHNQRIVFANEVFLKNTGWVGKDTRGMHLSEIHGPELYASRTQFIEQALRGETVSYEAVGRRGDGMGFFHHEFKPNFDAKGNVVGIFATATDISDRRDIEVQLESKQDELVRSNRDLEQFAYVASHDLKAPLRAIDILVQWLQEDLKDHEGGDVHEHLDLLGQRTERLGRLLDDLLAYSRVGRRVGDLVEVDCAELIRDMIELMGKSEGISIEAKGELPTFMTYSAPLEQVFRNLIGNAVKHHPGPTGKVSIACEEAEDHYLFSVADDGAGIPPEYAERVFQMFQTLRPRDEVEGSGIGLAIVSRIVEWQGGRVWFDPGPDDRGTVFSFQWQKSAPDRERAHTTEEAAHRQAE